MSLLRPFARRPLPERPTAPYLMAVMTVVLLGLMAGVWAVEARLTARSQEANRLSGLAEAFAAHIDLTINRYMDLMLHTAVLPDESTLPAPALLTSILLQNPYLLGIRYMESTHTLVAVERPGSLGVFSWPPFHGHHDADGETDIHMHTTGVIHLHHYLGDQRVVEMVVDRQALLSALKPLIDVPGRSVGLFTEGGALLARMPTATTEHGGSIPPPELDDDGRMIYTKRSPFDGMERVIAWTRVGDKPMLLEASMPLEIIDARWRDEAFLVAIVWAILSLAGLLMAHRLVSANTAAMNAMTALHRNEAELSSLFHQNRHLLGLLDTSGKIQRVNGAALDIIGMREEDIIGQPFWEAPWWREDPLSQDDLRDKIARVALGDVQEIVAPHRDLTGRLHIVESSLSPIRDDRGNVTGILAEGRDITDQLAAERDADDQRQRLELALETTEQGLWDWTVPTQTMIYSDQVPAMVGDRPEDWPDGVHSWRARIHPDDRAAVDAALTTHLKGDSRFYEAEYRMRHRDGTWLWMLDKGKVVARDDDGKAVRVIGTHADITQRREAEERLKALARALEDSNRNLEQFAYVASHDLQEPLRMVSSYLGLIKRRKADVLDDEAQEFIGYATDGALRMSQLITDLLDYSRVTTRGHPFEAVPLVQPLRTALRDLKLAVEEAGAQVTIPDTLPTVLADESQLTQLFQNLIGNAIKYARPERPPRVTIDAVLTGTGVRVTVIDNGIGIEPAYRERVFRIFQRLHGRGTFSGTGIGLAVAQRIVERHGGTIMIEDAVAGDPAQGCAFVIDLPSIPPAASGTAPPTRPEMADA